MRYLKKYDKFYYEKGQWYEKVKPIRLYKNDEFRIDINNTNSLTFSSMDLACSAVFAMIFLVRENSKYLNDKKLRSVILREEDIDYCIEALTFKGDKYKNIENFKSSYINDFITDDKQEIRETIPTKVYMELTVKYYEILKNSIIKCKTLGDVIDEFKIIYEEFQPEFKLKLDMYNFNI